MKRVISLLLTIILALSCLPVAFAASFTDTEGHWASPYIEYMVSKKILDGYGDGTFLPEGQVTRAEFIKMLNETFGLTATTSISYTDVATTDWFYPHIVKAAAQGYLLNYGNLINPNGKLSRQEAAALIARYLDLDPNDKVATSTYPDYTTISQNYKDYVLQATYAGLFQGDAESGNFSPNRILKRGEALTILYRAAGSIYRTTTNGLESAANDKNAVISNSGVTVSGAEIKGRLLISEGASNGTVTLNACNIDELVIRGTASVVINGCSVGNIVIDAPAGYTDSITLSGNSTVLSVEAKSPIDMKLEAGTSVAKMTVESNAKNSAVTGTGTLTSVTVNATGFTAEKKPAQYTLATGITATLGGAIYNSSGAGATSSTTGFAATPSTYATTAACYLKAQPTVSGVLYYYFTNTATAPTADNFTTQYGAAAVKAYLQVTANTPVDKSIGTTATVSSYSYIALMIQGYQPVVIANQSSGGFASAPTVSTSGSYECLTFTPTVSGTLYYYYTTDATVPSTVTFMNMHNASTTLYKGTLSAVANQSLPQNTVLAANVTALPYIAVCLVDAQGNVYQPIVVSKTGSSGTASAGDTGFTTAPFCEYNAGTVSLGLIPSVNGAVEYYFTTVPTVPTSDQFTANKTLAGAQYSGSFGVTQNTPYYSAFATDATIETHPYAVLRLTSAFGVKYQPVVVTLPKTAAVDITGSGFSTVPSTTMTGGYFYIQAQTTSAGQLYYYLTNYSVVPSEDTFIRNYEASVTGTNLASANGGVVTLTYGSQSAKTNITNDVGRSFEYLALMFKVSGKNYKPVLIPITGGTESNYNETSNGFRVAPTYEKASNITYNVRFTTNVSGTVWYYFTDVSTVPTCEQVKQNVEIERANNAAYAGTINAIGNYPVQHTGAIGTIAPAYIVFMLQDTSGIYYLPVVVPTDASAAATAATGFTTTPTATTAGGTTTLSYNAVAAGTLYYYFADLSTPPVDSSAFLTQFIGKSSTGLSGTLAISAGVGTQNITALNAGNYLVLMLHDTASGTYRTPFVVTLNAGIGGIGGLSGNTGFYGTPTVSGGVLSYFATTTGTLNISFSTTPTVTSTSSLISMAQVPITTMGMGTVNLATAVPLFGSVFMSNFQYVVVWISGLTTMTPVVIPMNGSSSGSGTSSLSGNGFTVAPQLQPFGSSMIVTFTPSVTGTVKYFFTNATTKYDAATFQSTYNSLSGNAFALASPTGTQTVQAGMQGMISVNSNYKYMWIMIDSGAAYAPVCVQISA